jgi:hypothetical protein
MHVSSRLDYICYCKREFTNKYISWMYLSVDQLILPCVNNIKELMNGLCVCDCVSMHAVLVEKILRVQPHVHKMYLLVRAIDAPSANHRVQQEVPQFLLLMIIPITRRTKFHHLSPLHMIIGFHHLAALPGFPTNNYIYRARLVQLHERLHEQLHNFNSQTTSSLPSSLASFSENSLTELSTR